ncbi:MAG: hypothetical protein KDD11_06415 [Acidobacteria bacterium]|nr:hypothetical protein [Acidobacteriota bacterium]
MVLLVAAHVSLLLLFDLGGHRWAALSILTGAFAALWWAVRRLPPETPAGLLLAVAAILRVLLLPLPPTLSNDALRYLWDGRVAAAGYDPYALPPDAAELAFLRDGLWQELHHRDVSTVYPPLALGVFTLASVVPVEPALQLVFLKTLFAMADLAACGGLVYLARRRGLPVTRVAWYAWNPLVVLEVAGMGHVDALGSALAVAAVCTLLSRPAVSGLAAAGGVLAKLVPLLALPLWVRAASRPRRFAAVALAVIGLTLVLPVAVRGVPPGLVRYGVSWEFNGPLYEPLWRVFSAVGTPDVVSSVLDRVKDWTELYEPVNRLYPLNYPQLHAKLLLAMGLGVLWLVSWRWRDPVAGSGRLFGGMLLLSATVYPWYLLWALPWAALCRQPAWLLLSALLPWTYLAQGTGLALWPWLFAGIWIPFSFVLVSFPRWSST